MKHVPALRALQSKSESSILQTRSKLCIPRNKTARPHPQFPHSCICELCVYSHDRSTCSKIGRPIVRVYKSLIDTWMWKLGTRPSSFMSGNIWFAFSVKCLCSVSRSQKYKVVQRIFILWPSSVNYCSHLFSSFHIASLVVLGTKRCLYWGRYSVALSYLLLLCIFRFGLIAANRIYCKWPTLLLPPYLAPPSYLSPISVPIARQYPLYGEKKD